MSYRGRVWLAMLVICGLFWLGVGMGVYWGIYG